MSDDEDNSSEQIFNKLEEYMFTRGNMAKYNKVFSAMIVEKIKEEKRIKQEEQLQEHFKEQLLQLQKQLLQKQNKQNASVQALAQAQQAQAQQAQAQQAQAQQAQAQQAQAQAHGKQSQAQAQTQAQAHGKQSQSQAQTQAQHTQTKKDTQFTPFQKDNLFWCFYIIYKGFEEYELHNSDHFSVEKNFKISTVEKMRSMKDKFKEEKLKINEIENELANQQTITLKGLHALCLVHGVSITYIYGRKYCEFLHSTTDASQGVIIKNNKNDHSVKYDANEAYMTDIHNTFWKIENVQKPLGSPSMYSVKELQDICSKLEISIVNTETGKNKLKTVLYEDIIKTL